MRIDWKRIILELVLQTLMELAPVSLDTLATLAEYVVQLTHTQRRDAIQLVFPGSEQQLKPRVLALTLCRFSAPSLS